MIVVRARVGSGAIDYGDRAHLSASNAKRTVYITASECHSQLPWSKEENGERIRGCKRYSLPSAWYVSVMESNRGCRPLDQFTSVPSPVGSSGDMRDDSAEILSQSFLPEAIVSNSGMLLQCIGTYTASVVVVVVAVVVAVVVVAVVFKLCLPFSYCDSLSPDIIPRG